eukprot:5089585-Prymnesium_polylepis.1
MTFTRCLPLRFGRAHAQRNDMLLKKQKRETDAIQAQLVATKEEGSVLKRKLTETEKEARAARRGPKGMDYGGRRHTHGAQPSLRMGGTPGAQPCNKRGAGHAGHATAHSPLTRCWTASSVACGRCGRCTCDAPA